MRVSEYLSDRLARCGARHVFLVTGGGADAPNDALQPPSADHSDLQPPRTGRSDGRRGLGTHHW